MRTFLSWPIRAHMCLLVLLLALPAMGVIIRSGIGERREAVIASTGEMEKLVHTLAFEITLLVDNTRQLSLTLSHLPEVQSHNAASLNPFLKELLGHYPYYATILVTDRNGIIRASSRPVPEGVSLADRRYFKEAVATGRFSAGEYVIGRLSGLPTVSFGYPLKDKKGVITGVICISLDLRATDRLLVRGKLPANTGYVIFDHMGTFLFRGTDTDRFAGKRDRPDLFERMRAGVDAGVFEAFTNDGVYRRVAYRKLRLENGQPPYMYIRAGVPVESATRAANSALLRDLGLYAPFLVVALALGWFVGRRCVVDRIYALRTASRSLAAGDLSIRVEGRVSGGELGELALAFDSMAQALQSREQEVRDREQQLRRVLDSVHAFIGVLTPEGVLVEVNQVTLEMAGITSGQVVGKPLEETHWWSWSPQAQGQLREAIARATAGETVRYDVLLKRQDGQFRHVDFMLAPLRDDHGKVTHLIPSGIDITARKQAEAALQKAHDELEQRVDERTVELARTVESLQREIAERKKVEKTLGENETILRALVDTNPESLLLIDPEGTILVINDTCAKRLNTSVSEAVGKNAYSFLPPDVAATRRTYVEAAVAGGRPVRFDDMRNGRFIEHYLHPITAANGEVAQLAILGIDLTDHKRIEEALKQETAQRVEALESLREHERIMIQQNRQAAMGEMISNIAHQWRQPLNTLGMIIQRLRLFHEMGEFSGELLGTSTQEAMRLIKHMSGTIDDFSGFFKPDKNKVVFSVNEAIRQTISLVNASFSHQQITLSVFVDGDPRINGYPNEYSQALLNILLNARDALAKCPAQEARITVHAFVDDAVAVVTIADNAAGIPADVVDKIFDPHFTTKGPKGTGLGLFMAKNIIERNMNGSLTARNTGNGAEFRIAV